MPDDHASSADPAAARRPGKGDGPEGETAAPRQVRVLLPLPLPAALDYLAPDCAAPPEPGSYVRVPLGVRSLAGVVWDGAGNELPVERLKPVLETLPVPKLRPELRRFVGPCAASPPAPPRPAPPLTV